MDRIIFTLGLLLTLSSCNSEKVNNDVLQKDCKPEIASLQNTIDSLNVVISHLSTEISEKAQERVYNSEDEALKYIKDYFDFYDPDQVVKDIKLRRTDNNVFLVSLQECVRQSGCCDYDPLETCYQSVVYELIISDENNYSLKYKKVY